MDDGGFRRTAQLHWVIPMHWPLFPSSTYYVPKLEHSCTHTRLSQPHNYAASSFGASLAFLARGPTCERRKTKPQLPSTRAAAGSWQAFQSHVCRRSITCLPHVHPLQPQLRVRHGLDLAQLLAGRGLHVAADLGGLHQRRAAHQGLHRRALRLAERTRSGLERLALLHSVGSCIHDCYSLVPSCCTMPHTTDLGLLDVPRQQHQVALVRLQSLHVLLRRHAKAACTYERRTCCRSRLAHCKAAYLKRLKGLVPAAVVHGDANCGR
jgi:hypothetical protein